MTIYHKGNPKPYRLTLSDQQMPVPAIKSNLQFFKWLKEIQIAYHVRFDRPGDYTRDDFHNARLASTFANGQTHTQKWTDELSFQLEKDMPKEMLDQINGNSLTAIGQAKEEVLIYGQNIVLGHKIVEVNDLVLINREEIDRGETNHARVRSACGNISISYSPEFPIDNTAPSRSARSPT